MFKIFLRTAKLNFICDIIASCYKRGIIFNMRISIQKKMLKIYLYRIYPTTCTLSRYIVYDSLNLILLWLLSFRWTMWPMGLLFKRIFISSSNFGSNTHKPRFCECITRIIPVVPGRNIHTLSQLEDTSILSSCSSWLLIECLMLLTYR